MKPLHLFLLSLLLVTAPVTADPLKVMILNAAPFGLVGADGKPQGQFIELIKAVMLRAKLPYSVEIVPIKRAYISLETGKADISVLIDIDQQLQGVRQLGPVGVLNMQVWGTAGSDLRDPKALVGKSVGRLRDGCMGLKRTVPGAFEWIGVDSFLSGMRMLRAGRLDGLCGPTEALQEALLQAGGQASEVGTPFILNNYPLWIKVASTVPEATMEQLQTALQAMEHDGSLRRLMPSSVDAHSTVK